MKYFYLFLCILGTVLPYSQFIPFIFDHGANFNIFFQQLFANRISGFFGLDVIVSAIVIIAFILSEGKRKKMRHLWLPFISTFVVGASLGLPLFLFMREIRLENQ
ncbi:MAG: DUF2834 domain-containing protein [Candidatus Aminicenantes bacterium]|jgi:hypothetical protein